MVLWSMGEESRWRSVSEAWSDLASVVGRATLRTVPSTPPQSMVMTAPPRANRLRGVDGGSPADASPGSLVIGLLALEGTSSWNDPLQVIASALYLRWLRARAWEAVVHGQFRLWAAMAGVLLGGASLIAIPAGPAAAAPAASSTTQATWATYVTLKDSGGAPGPGISFGVSSVACVSADDCTAVGLLTSAAEESSDVVGYHWDGTTWIQTQIQSFPGPSGLGNELNGVSCISADLCLAVGTFFAQWGGRTWSTSTQPTDGDLNGVSCPSATFCMAVGTQRPGAVSEPLAEEWNGSTWSGVPSPVQGDLDNSLNGISCTSATSCIAVGSADSGLANQTLVEQWNGATWAIVASPSTSPTVDNVLNGVSCVSPTMCKAVGASGSSASAHEQPLIESWNGMAWSTDTGPSASQPARLGAISCVSSDVCMASGYSTSVGGGSGVFGPLFESSSGGSWELQSPGTSRAAGDGISCTSPTQCAAVGGDGAAGAIDMLSTQGYWEVASDGGIFSFGAATFHGSMGGQPLNAAIVGMAAPPGGTGYWEVGADGGIFAFGDARYYGSMGSKPLNKPIVDMAATPDGKGYWLVASDGGVFSFGDAGFFGSMGGTVLDKPIVGMAPTPDGQGYWEVAADGGVFAFGDAVFEGSTGGQPLNAPIVGTAGTSNGICLDYSNSPCDPAAGYYLVASDGGVFAFGADSYGSMGGMHLNEPVVAMMVTADAGGYWEVASDGGVFTFGSAAFEGSMGGQPLNAPVVGAAAAGNQG